MTYGRYQIEKEIGKGAMGIVYKARDPNLDLFVALKVLRRDQLDNEALVKRFLREAKVLGRLDRANIVRVYNVDEDSGNVYIAMEFVEGEPLRDIMKRKRFSLIEIVKMGITIANALDYAHQQGVVHRDVKPSNILIRADKFIKITDFGIAHIHDPESQLMTQAGEILGTPSYMAPEQVRGAAVNKRSDIFSLGIILYELCTGEKPFKGENMSEIFEAILTGEPVPVSDVNPSIPPEISQIIMKCINKNPDERFLSGRQLAVVLEGYMKSQQKETIVLTGPAPKKKSSKVVLYSLLTLLTLALAGNLVYHFILAPKNLSVPPVEKAERPFLDVDSLPAGAQVFINGVYRGVTPLKSTLSAGTHQVRLSAPGYKDWKSELIIKAAGGTPLSAQLIPEEAPVMPFAEPAAPLISDTDVPAEPASGPDTTEGDESDTKPAPDAEKTPAAEEEKDITGTVPAEPEIPFAEPGPPPAVEAEVPETPAAEPAAPSETPEEEDDAPPIEENDDDIDDMMEDLDQHFR